VVTDQGERPLVRPRPIRVAGVELDFVRRAAMVGGTEVHLSGSALGLLYLLGANAGRVLTRDEIQGALWARDRLPASNVVDRLVSQLRRALGDGTSRSRLIETVVGGGYRVAPDAGAHPARGRRTNATGDVAG
jgi:two-component system, OmpR family, response regulator RstA